MKGRIEGPLATIEMLETADPALSWDEIWALIQRFYEADRGYVEELIRHHGSIALCRTAGDGRLVGITALDVYPTEFEGRKVAVIFTSHVMLEEAFRGQNLLQRLGWRTFLRTRLRFPITRSTGSSTPSATRATCCCHTTSATSGRAGRARRRRGSPGS